MTMTTPAGSDPQDPSTSLRISSGASDGAKTPQLSEPERAPRARTLLGAGVGISLIAALASLFLFGWIAEEVRHGETASFDLAVRDWVHQFASPAMTRVMTAISMLGYKILIIELVVALSVFLYLRWRRAAVWLAVTMAGALALELALKYAFHRPRPPVFVGAEPGLYSFPSGHALSSFCFYAVMAGLIASRVRSPALRIAVGALAALLVIAIGVSRVYLGMHYPSDVIGGYLAAAVWVSAMLVLDRWRVNRRKLADRRRFTPP
jgi:undecaprenyl-diphosphatase